MGGVMLCRVPLSSQPSIDIQASKAVAIHVLVVVAHGDVTWMEAALLVFVNRLGA